MVRKGFTLIELIVVIAIIAILAAIVAPNAFRAIEKAKISGSIEDYRSMKTAAMAYYSDVGGWVANCTGQDCVVGFVTNNSTTPILGWDGPYLEKWPQTTKWSGNYTWFNYNGTNFGPTPAVGERWISIANVPLSAAQRIDDQFDGSRNGTTGMVRYGFTSGNGPVNISVSRDGPMN
jgi:general secretion pathway protein G